MGKGNPRRYLESLPSSPPPLPLALPCLALPKGGDSSSPLLLPLAPARPGSSTPQLFTSTSCPWRLVHGVVLPPLLSPWFTTSTSIHLEARLHPPQLCKEKASIHIQMVIHLHPKSTSIAILLHLATLDPLLPKKKVCQQGHAGFP